MSRRTDKRALVAPQAVNAANALAYQAAAADFHHALAVTNAPDQTDDEVMATADAWAAAADRLIGTPAPSLRAVAEKVEVFANLHNGDSALMLRNPDHQRRVAQHGCDLSKGLLAIYLDLAALTNSAPVQASADRAAWDKALTDYAMAQAVWRAIDNREAALDDDEHSDEWRAADKRSDDTLDALMALRAPDAQAMADRSRIIVENMAVYIGDNPDNPEFVARLLAGPWEDRGVAMLYQDALALAGATGPVVEAKADTFDAEEWLATVCREHGVKWESIDPEAMYPDHRFIHDGPSGDTAAADAALAALSRARVDEVATYQSKETSAAREEARRERDANREPMSKAELRQFHVDCIARLDGEG